MVIEKKGVERDKLLIAIIFIARRIVR